MPDLEAAVERYEAVLGVSPCEEAGAAPTEHPFSTKAPVVFELGEVALALYQCDMRSTHPGDVGIGLQLESSPKEMAERAEGVRGKVFFGPRPFSDRDRRELAVFVLPDRHFFEVMGPKKE